MRDINVVVLVGRLTRDAELKYTKSGTAIARFSLAVNRSRKQDDQWVDETSFFDIDFWGKGAEAGNRYLTKGQQVAVEGELRQDRWEQDGQPRSKVIVNASNVRLMGSSSGNQGSGPSTKGQPYGAQDASAGPRSSGGASAQNSSPIDSFDDDIPF